MPNWGILRASRLMYSRIRLTHCAGSRTSVDERGYRHPDLPLLFKSPDPNREEPSKLMNNRILPAICIVVVGIASTGVSSADAGTPGALAALLPPTVDPTILAVQAAAAQEKLKTQAAQAEARLAQEAKERAEAQLNEAKTTKLIQLGVTAGFAVVGQSNSPGGGTDGAKQVSFSLTTMPYLALVPAYWFIGDYNRTYCSSKFFAGDRVAATKATLERVKQRKRLALPPEEQRNLDSADLDVRKKADDDLAKTAMTVWDPEKDGKCAATYIGLWVGKPLAYNAVVTPATNVASQKLEVNPAASAGFGIFPNAYVAILLGVTHSSVDIPAQMATATAPVKPEAARSFVTFTFGLGGNLDILGAIFK